MRTVEKILLIVGGSITLCFGVWHFFVPTNYKWFSYLTTVPNELKNAIKASNFFISAMLVILGVETLYFTIVESSEIAIIMILMSGLWLIRTVYQIVNPQGSSIQHRAEVMTAIFVFASLCFIIPLIIELVNAVNKSSFFTSLSK